jgi:putative ABC transport system ATP-binding protein
MAPLVQFRNVSKVYENGASQVALQDLSLSIEAGERVAVMGPSGSGKSTLLNLIAGLDAPSDGTVSYDGVDLATLEPAAVARHRLDHVGFIFQFFNLLPNLSVLENVLLPAQLAGSDDHETTARCHEVLERLGLTAQAREYPAKLSGGQRQLAAVARALINRPALLLADEPTGALDTSTGDDVMALLEELGRDGRTMILVTHNPELAARHADRVVSLRDGQIVDEAVLHSARSMTAADLIRIPVEETVA